MPISNDLLERAYQLVNTGQFQNAELVLDAVVRVDPKNVPAWKAYLRIYQNSHDLDWLMERILKVKELSDLEKADIRSYYDHLLQNLIQSRQIDSEKSLIPSPVLDAKLEAPAQEEKVVFELIEEFDYPARKSEQKKRKKRRELFKYNMLASVWQGLGLLAVFYFGVHLLVLKFLFGYMLMGAFIVGTALWLKRLNDQKPVLPTKVSHTYSLDSEKKLTVIKKPVVKQKAGKSSKTH